jgi:hypothetical protein
MCAHGGCPENWRIKKKLTKWACPCNISDGIQMKKICLTGLLLGTNHGCVSTILNQSVLQCNGNIPVHVQPKSSKLKVTQSASHVLGLAGSTVIQFSEAWWKCEFCIILWSSVETSWCNLQKICRPAGKRGTAHHDNARPYTAWATQERIQELQWGLPEHLPYNLDLAPNPDLAPSDFHLFGPLKNHLGGQRFTDDEKVEMEVRKWLRQQSKDFYAAGFDALVKRWDKCINVGGWYVKK